MYHFRLKSDKKPNGTKISAVKHVEYINREGTFAHDERWKQTNKFVDNFISTVQTPNALDGLNALLYKTDDFGSIRNSQRGIEVTENFSHTTIAIALMLADKTLNHRPLIINGSPDFHKAVLEVALQDNLSISFHDELMQETFELRKQRKENERRKFLASGGYIISSRPKTQFRIHPARAKTIEEAIKNGSHLPSSSQLPSLKGMSEGIKLTEDEVQDLDQFMQEQYQRVHYDFSDEQKRLAQLTAKKILENIEEALKQQSAVSHAEYINRGGCIFQFHRLPKWAHDDPKKFFQAADKYEEPSFEEKWKRGAPKDRKWCNRQYVSEMRADFAQIQNEVLRQNGFSICVDHRTLQVQKEDAERNGDTFLARQFLAFYQISRH